MVDFRKSLMLLALVLVFSAVASAQVTPVLQCVANAGVPPLVRSEDIAGQNGDVTLNCTGGDPTDAGVLVPKVNVQIFLNTNVTSRLLSNPWSEALLLIDEPNGPRAAGVTSPKIRQCGLSSTAYNGATGACDVLGTGLGITTYDGNSGHPNAFQGQQAAANSIVWLGIPLDPPGTSGTRVVRMTNVRVHAAGLAGTSTGLIPAQVVTFISISGPMSISLNNPQQVTAFITPGLTFSVRDFDGGTDFVPYVFLQCVSYNFDLAGDPTRSGFQYFRLRYTENFATAFKVRSFQTDPTTVAEQDIPGLVVNTESMFVNAVSGTNPAFPPRTDVPGGGGFGFDGFGTVSGRGNFGLSGQATQGTRLMARFNNVPAGVRMYVSNRQMRVSPFSTGSGLRSSILADLVTTASDGSGAYSPTPSSGTLLNSTVSGSSNFGIAEISIVGGAAVAVWEVITNTEALSAGGSTKVTAETQILDGASQIESVDFGVLVAYRSNTGAGLPALGTATVNGSYAPLSTVTTASSSAPVPRFVDSSTARNAFRIIACVCNLLFPFITNAAGFDTGISIANTTADIFGTAAQQGTVTVNYFGTTTGGGAAPPAATSAVIPAGGMLLYSLSTGNPAQSMPAAPGFTGYMMSTSRFQFCHGFAYISDLGVNRHSMGYVALVLDDAFFVRGNALGEVLGH